MSAEKISDRERLLERYVQSVAIMVERENLTDQERVSYIKGHPITREAAEKLSLNAAERVRRIK